MKKYNISLDEETVRELFLEGVEGVTKSLMEQMLNQLLEAKAEDLCNAKRYEQTDERTDYRNGTRTRPFTTRFGKIELEVPRLRSQSVAEGLYDNYQRSEQAIIAAVAEMVVKGVSTRDVDDVALALFGEGISKSQASRMCAVLDPVVAEFRARGLDEYYPFVIVVAVYLDVREGARVVSNALYVALGVNASGRREVLGFTLARAETKESYKDFFASLKARGLKRVDLVVSDDHSGLKGAVKEVFLGASWQRCQTHFARNMCDKTPKAMWKDTKAMLHDIYYAPDIDKARERMRETVALLSGKAPKAAAMLESGFEDITAVFALPQKYRVKLRTSNAIERVNGEIRRRDRAIRICPGEGSVMRIIGTLLLETHNAWHGERLYLDMKEYLSLGNTGGSDERRPQEAAKAASKEAA
ncbi:MAG: IS256 family transposase [Coriobacteriales bacterium]|nr:IS256 family transposase [Coriobacteriales bacterium]